MLYTGFKCLTHENFFRGKINESYVVHTQSDSLNNIVDWVDNKY